jgi:hypothetical protein
MRFANAQKVSRKDTSFAPRWVSAVKLFDALRIPSSDAHVIRRPRRPGDSNVKIQRLGAGALVCGILLLSASAARAQEKNEIGLVIGSAVTPSRNFSSGSSATVAFDSSLALGAEYDRRLLPGRRASVYGGVDFLASPLDVKLSNPPSDVIGQYAYVFLTPHVRVKFSPDGRLSPWLLFGGGYARFLEKKPTAEPSFVPGTNTGTFVFGGGIDSRTVLHVFRVPIGFRVEVRDFYSGSPDYNQQVHGSLQNNVVFTGGLLIKF